MNKFIIIDHSLCDLQGHHYECSISVAEAAARAGYQPIIIANRSFSQSLQTENIQVIPAFEVDWFNQPTLNKSQENNNFRLPFEQNIEVFKQLFLIGKKQRNHNAFQLYALRLTYPRWAILIEKIEGSLERLSQGFQQDLQLLTKIPFANTFWRLLKIVGGFLFLGWKLIKKIFIKFLSFFNWQKKQYFGFTETLEQVLPSLSLNSEDHVFIHTLGIEQLEELYYWLINRDRALLPTYHILLRRDTEDPLVLQAKGMGLKKCLQAYSESQLWPTKIRFYTDTENLVYRHNQLSPIQFSRIPIPFRQEQLAVSLPLQKKEKTAIHIVYLGDARPEKGYQHLPALVAALWPQYLSVGKVFFTIQSNYNVQGGEIGILEAKLALAQYPESKVKLIHNPISTAEYYQLLASADIVILPYNPQNYQRTSGVLTEALAAGKPVVVPEGSWLAQQVDQSRASIYAEPQQLPQAVIRLIDNLSSFTEAAQKFSLYWREQQSPDLLIQCLLNPPTVEINLPIQASNNPERSPQETPKILILMAGEAIITDGSNTDNSVRALNYFCHCGYQVYGVFYGQQQNLDREHWEQFSQSVRQATQHYGLQGSWILEPQANLGKPSDCSDEQYQRYIEDSFYQRPTVFNSWVSSAYLSIPTELLELLPTLKMDLVYIDSVLYSPCLKKLGLGQLPVIGEVSQLYAYHSALVNSQDLDHQELDWEIHLLKQCKVLLTVNPAFAEKIQELTQNPLIYAIAPWNAAIEAKGTRQASYNQALNQACLDILGNKALSLKAVKSHPKIAILYPWGNIQDRKSGASQRTGMLWDYLREQSYEVRFFTLGEQRSRWQAGVCYEYHDSVFSPGDLMKKAYGDAYRSWYSLFEDSNLNSHLNLPIIPTEGIESWLPWIYYQFRLDPNFQQWLENIIDWADVVILEYPFWAESVNKICHRKQVRWLLTAHDVLAKNLAPDTMLFQIALTEELQALRQADAVITLSVDDQAFFAKYGIQSSCVPIGVDLQKVQTLNSQKALAKPNELLALSQDWERPFCLFIGSNHQPNLEAVKQIQLWCQEQTLAFDLVVVGSCWPTETAGNFLALGKVSEQSLVYLYQKATLVLAPLTMGTGMSVKIIEAMAYGKVVLGTAIAFRGYPVKSGVNCLICDKLNDYPDQIQQLIQQPEVLEKIGPQAQEFAKAYDYRQLYKTYLDLILQEN
jgi:glycosyltransferase involved in cell wall biosynthesis